MADATNNNGAAFLGTSTALPSALMDLLSSDDLVPGNAPSYQTCKTIYTYHPLGAKMAESPIRMAQSQKREIQIPGSPDKELKEAFEAEWKKINADVIIRNAFALSRVYGLSCLVMGGEVSSSHSPIRLDRVADAPLYFNVLDPLNTSGSLTLNQDPNSKDFLKPSQVSVSGQAYHPSRCIVMMNEQPVYIQWTDSAFGFVGRSVYQRALYPLKSYIQSMITDNFITEKCGLLVAKLKAPGSIIDQMARSWFGIKRSAIKGGKTGNVLSVGVEESVESLQLMHMRDAAEFARNNILKNIATAADMPASLINQETMAEGFGEGTEDAKNIARYIDGVRIECDPLYNFLDQIVMRRAWTKELYASIQAKYSKYKRMPYLTAFMEWKNSFKATWPSLLTEPESELVKKDKEILDAVVGLFEIMVPVMGQGNKALMCEWVQNIVNSRKMIGQQLELDIEEIEKYEPPSPIPTPNREPETKEAYDA